LCDDERLRPAGACRLCLVQVSGQSHLVPACGARVAEGMAVETHTPAIEDTRRTLLQLLAAAYPASAVAQSPEKLFHRWLAHYHVELDANGNESVSPARNSGSQLGASTSRFHDDSHPYLHVDMARCITCFRCLRICNEVQGQFVWHAVGRGANTHIVPDGAWEMASWREAFNFIATNLTCIIEESGSNSIGVLGSARGTNEENYLAQKFARVVLGTNNVDCCAR
jgi:formate dehydrogenase major subunit